MKSTLRFGAFSLLCVSLTLLTVAAQENATTPAVVAASDVVPSLINYNGVLKDSGGRTLTSLSGVTFLLYKDEQDGAPLWVETQNVQPDKTGHYTVALGSATSHGLPAELFASGEARWLGVQIDGQPEQARVLLLSVPYALKASDAETLGGMPPSAFVQATSVAPHTPSATNRSLNASATSHSSTTTPLSVGGSGTAGYLARWTSSTNLGNAAFFQNSTGSVGLSTITPTQKFEVDFGNLLVRGPSNFKGSGQTAFLYVGDTSHPIEAIWNTGLAIGTFQVPKALFIQDRSGNVGIGTTAPTATLNVVASKGSIAVSATGSPGTYTVQERPGITASGGYNADTNNIADGGVFTGGNGISAIAAGGPFNIGCGGMFAGGNTGGTACVGVGNDKYLDGSDGIQASPSTQHNLYHVYAGNFTGDLNVTGAIFAGKKDFRIDHPLDPANKYLNHASVESSEMKDIYDGTVVTDGNGDAVVQLPEWFETLNGDFRYQLTVIGQFAQAIVASEIKNHQFSIKTDKPNVKVSWQVTGIRQDAFARTHPLLVEEPKPTNLRGYYIHPELYGQSQEKQIEWGRHPAMMKRMKDIHDEQARNLAKKSMSP